MGWKIIIVWECTIKKVQKKSGNLQQLIDKMKQAIYLRSKLFGIIRILFIIIN